MRTIGMRELNQRTSAIVHQLRESGESVIVTDHGKEVALLSPLGTDPVERLVRSGVLAEGSDEWTPVSRVLIPRSTEELLAEIDAEPTWE